MEGATEFAPFSNTTMNFDKPKFEIGQKQKYCPVCDKRVAEDSMVFNHGRLTCPECADFEDVKIGRRR